VSRNCPWSEGAVDLQYSGMSGSERFFFGAVLGAAMAMTASSAHANTITIHSLTAATAPDAVCNLHEGMARAVAGGTATECAPTGPTEGPLEVVLPAGTADLTLTGTAYTLTGETIIRGAGASMTTLRNISAGRLLLFHIAAGARVTLEGIAMTGFHGPEGTAGAVFAQANSRVTIRDCAFRDGVSDQYGGAIRMMNAGSATSLAVFDSTFEGNSAFDGAAIAASDAVVSVTGSTFRDNSGDTAPGITVWLNAGETLTVTDCTFEDNHAIGAGGVGIVLSRGRGNVLVEGSTFTDNDSANGGVLFVESPAIVRDSVFRDNEARTGQGGAIYVGGAALTIEESTFEDNRSGDNGGAICCSATPLTIDRSRFARNVAVREGGAVFQQNDYTVTDSVFFDNVAAVEEITVTAIDDRATEGGDDGVFAIGRRMVGSAIRSWGTGTITGSCFVASSRAIVAGLAAIDARGNYWSTDDEGIRATGTVDTSGALAAAPEGCDPTEAPTIGALATMTELAGTAEPGIDYAAVDDDPSFAPGASDVLVPIDALLDGAEDPDESVILRWTNGSVTTEAQLTIAEGMPADVSVSKTVDRTEASVGDELVFTLTVANAGPGVAADVVVTDLLPLGLTPLGATVDAPEGALASCEPGPPPSCTISELAAGESATVTVRTRIDPGASDITNRAEVVFAGDPDPINNSSEVLVRIASAETDGGSPDRDGGAPSADAGAGASADDGGCGCRAVSPAGGAGTVAFAVVLSALLRRRSRARAIRSTCSTR
jgi:uncharacterized repeat protein (TIGR01451 family)